MGKVNLATERLRLKLTQEEIATLIGITKSAYSNLENGNRKPSYDVLCKLESLFKKPHTYLFGVAAPVKTKTPDGNQSKI